MDEYKELYKQETKKHHKAFEPFIKEGVLWQMRCALAEDLQIDIQTIYELDIEELFDELD